MKLPELMKSKNNDDVGGKNFFFENRLLIGYTHKYPHHTHDDNQINKTNNILNIKMIADDEDFLVLKIFLPLFIIIENF